MSGRLRHARRWGAPLVFTLAGSSRTFFLDWTTSGHTSVDVPVTAAGPLSDRFSGKHPNTYVHDVLAQVLAPRR
ncbi:alkaline phosphatase [Streptomyces sp. NPDC006733]|uniref:alkaline phosphatase n=1 Tax=Streptomyces sp. NPDC006733 TaxID=3155460 RepID=UPI0034005C4E